MLLTEQLISMNHKLWDQYLHHKFIKELEKGTLPKQNFLFYLKQDYIYLFHYAKCYALLAIKSSNMTELRFALKEQKYILEGEMALHKDILSRGINPETLDVTDESLVNIAYTRYIFSIGSYGDFLDLLVALSACAIGYADIGREIYKNLDGKLENHPYREWIEMYSNNQFQKDMDEFKKFLDSYSGQVNKIRLKKLSNIFGTVIKCERDFWQSALDMNDF